MDIPIPFAVLLIKTGVGVPSECPMCSFARQNVFSKMAAKTRSR